MSFGDKHTSSQKKHGDLYYEPISQPKVQTDTQNQRKQISYLNNQVMSLKEVITIMEKEKSQSIEFTDKDKLLILLQRWRKKVYECLVTNKRFELIMQDNLKKFSEDQTSLQASLSEKSNQIEIQDKKIESLENENAFLKSQHDHLSDSNQALEAQVRSLTSDNHILKQGLIQMSEQHQNILTGH